MNQAHLTRFSTRLRLLCGLALFLGLCIMLGGMARPAHAQSTLSISDCSSDAQLQAAVAQANRDNAGDVITFACSGDITLSSTLTISGGMTLSGSGQHVTLDGGGSLQVLYVNGGISLTLNALTIADGSPNFGAGGLDNLFGTVTISNSTFTNNSGGGLSNGGTVTINNSTFANNTGGYGGGLYNGGTVTISNSTFANNSADRGGGIWNTNSGTVTISNSTLANNSAGDGDGGLENFGTVTISNSTVANNTGAGLDNVNTISISGSIVANNTVGDCASGGGSYIDNGYNLGCFGAVSTNAQLGPLASNGGPTQTMAPLKSSPAIDAIPLSTHLCPSSDQRGNTRPDDPAETACDIGAYESNYPDNDLGLANVPANMTVNATSSQGATVTYTKPSATDESGDHSTASVTCDHASGSVFPIGTTTVTCTATDSDDSNSPVSGSFTVMVKGAAAQVKDLTTTVNSFHLSSSLQTALDAKLSAALKAINGGQKATACSDLSDFIGQVQAQTGKGITASQATQLVAAAKQVQAVLGC